MWLVHQFFGEFKQGVLGLSVGNEGQDFSLGFALFLGLKISWPRTRPKTCKNATVKVIIIKTKIRFMCQLTFKFVTYA